MRRHLIAFDLEATCWRQPPLSERQAIETEIIEIGAVRLHPVTREEEGRFEMVVRPTRHTTLSPYCKELTGIEQADVDGALHFTEAWRRFHAWLEDTSTCEMISWGRWDIQQIERQIAEIAEEAPEWTYTDAQREYGRWCRARELHGRSRKLTTVAQDLGLSTGATQHRALADAARLAQVVATLRDPNVRTEAADSLLGLLKQRASEPTHRGHARQALGMNKGEYTAAANELVHLQLVIDLGDGQGLRLPVQTPQNEKTTPTSP